MAPYIGSATSRVDGVAKVTGAAKYAAEFNTPGLAHASMVAATIAKGRIRRIDTGAASRVKGVLTVLTHENRPPMADKDEGWKDDVAPDGSPFRPLYDNSIMFNGQPIALVVAETSEAARHAASLVRVEYEQEPHVTDIYRAARRGCPGEGADEPDGGRVRAAEAARRARRGAGLSRRAPRGRILHSDRASQSDGALCLDGGVRAGRQAHGLRQDPGRAERAEISLRRVRHEAGGRARHVALHGWRLRFRPAPAVPGGAGGARGARVAALGAGGADAGADVRDRSPAGDDPENRARRQCRRHARRHHPRRGHHHLAIRGLPPAGDRLVRRALQGAECEIRAPARPARSRDLVRHARAERHHRAVCARIRDGRACGQAQCRPARASPAVLFGA